MTALRPRSCASRGITLIEMLIVIVIAAVTITLVGPSVQDMLLRQRLRSVTSQLVTDLQYARAEAAARSEWVRFRFQSDGDQTCYVIFSSTFNSKRCNCLLGAGNACTDAATKEVKTTSVGKSLGVFLSVPAGQVNAFAFENVTGSISTIPFDTMAVPLPQFRVRSYIDTGRELWVTVNQAGRSTVCAPAGSTISETAC